MENELLIINYIGVGPKLWTAFIEFRFDNLTKIDLRWLNKTYA
jgi:hypothetical protein